MVSSILTNNGAMTALQSLKATQKNLLDTQNRISTGLKVGTAKDNAATWAVATSMRGDIANFKQVSENLSVSSGVVKTASTGTEQIASLISKIREQVTSVQDGVKNAATVQATIDEYVGQIEGIIGSSSYKGVNLINNSKSGNTQVLASVNADGDKLNPAYISIASQNLTMEAGGALEGLSRLTVDRAKDSYSYAPATGVAVSDKVSFTFKLNGVEKLASFTAATTSASDLMTGLKDAINAQAGAGNAFADIDVNGKLVVNAEMATDVVTFDGETALAKVSGSLTLGAATNNAPPAPKYSYGLTAAPAAGDVYSFNFKVDGQDKVATYTALTGESRSDVLTGLKNAINYAAGTGNEVASVDPNTGKLVVDAALGGSAIEFDGATALSKVNSTAGTGTPSLNGLYVYSAVTGTASANDTLSLSVTLNGSTQTLTTGPLAAGVTADAALGNLASQLNTLANGAVATVSSGVLTIDTSKSAGGVLLTMGGLAADITASGGFTVSGTAPTNTDATTLTGNLNRQNFDFNTTNAVNDVVSFSFKLNGADKVAKVTVEAGETHADVMTKLANAINAEAGSTVASVKGASGSEVLSVAGSNTANTGVEYTAASAISVQTHDETAVAADKKTPTTSTDYKELLGRLKTIESAVLAAGAAFGAAQTRIDLQKDFMDKLVDTLTSGVGALVDADMSEEAARLQALQVQEQLGTQALSIANQAPQSILSLFRG
ncbi:hypothetical protein E0493_19650 [Roseomonas sp. M0104]|uniref:Flagellin n=1 Tax=Teichococcus coralli TaxID=2545983 RepID=A0A845BJU8_9PROT|nr:flagellin [Pseudoroseomonas coralli]MXP65567.1 hypothetical protein [Pseudoroseomonas coralli]